MKWNFFKKSLGLILGTSAFFVVFLFSCSSKTQSQFRREQLKKIQTWACYYGSDSLDLLKLDQRDLLILEPDHSWTPPTKKDRNAIYIGYVSIGEAERFRWYWPLIEGQPWIIRENENWKDDFLIDIRSPEWQNILLDRIIPAILAKGYDGLFLDTMDTPIFLERDEGKVGSVVSLGQFIRKLREKYPEIYLISNNGLLGIDSWGEWVDAHLLESVHTSYDFKTKKYSLAQEPDWVQFRLTHLRKFYSSKEMPPLFVINYMESGNEKLLKSSRLGCEQLPCKPYQTSIDLMKIGVN